MSIIHRLSALVLFLLILAGSPTPVRADYCDEFQCFPIVVVGNEGLFECMGMTCYDAWVCFEDEGPCIVVDCDEYEAGSEVHVRCP